MKTELKKIYEGPMPSVLLLKATLEEKEIIPIIKDRSESATLAGFAAEIAMDQEVFVFEDQYEIV